MYPKLTYLLIAITFLVSSCNSDTGDDIKPTEGNELTFNVSNISQLSRSSVYESISHFLVFGDIISTASDASTHIVLFDKTKVEYKDGSWRYDGTQYWVPNYEHSFVGISPASIFENDNDPRYFNSRLSFDYSIPVSGFAADILIATHRRLYSYNGSSSMTDNRITFTFSHLLSLINIAPAFDDDAMSSEEYILFHGLKFSGISTNARFDISPAPRLTGSSTYDMEVDITGQKYDGDYSIDFPTPVKVGNHANNVNLFAEKDAIIMLPQVFTDDSEAEITLTYTLNSDTSMNEITLPLRNLKWESGKSYIYKFSIERSGVKFDSWEINPWNIIQGEEITVD